MKTRSCTCSVLAIIEGYMYRLPLSYNADVTKIKMLPKWLTLVQRYEILKKGAEMGVTLSISQPLQPS